MHTGLQPRFLIEVQRKIRILIVLANICLLKGIRDVFFGEGGRYLLISTRCNIARLTLLLVRLCLEVYVLDLDFMVGAEFSFGLQLL